MRYIGYFFVLIFVSTILGKNVPYFQQEAHYQINVTLHPLEKTYSGNETVIYVNHSPDTLNFVYMHLYPNAYKNNNTPFAMQQRAFARRAFYFSKKEERGYLNIANLTCDGTPVSYSYNGKAIDEIKIALSRPLLPGDSIKLAMNFEGKFPKMFSRMGYFGKGYFAVTQWYPKMVVYDRFGWHPDSYLNEGEFYGEFGSFDVRITVPQNYVVDATGMLQDNPEEKAFLKKLADTTRYALALPRAERRRFLKQWKKDRVRELQTCKETKTLRFVAHDVHNFAWFAGAQYFLLRKTHNNGVLTNVLVTPENLTGWRDVPKYVERTIAFYSKMVGPYLYPKASVVDGALTAGGGMEYPMITIISIPNFPFTHILEDVVMHEVGHNWFMGMLGSDERASTFLDEGMNSFLEYKYLTHYYGRYNLTEFKKLPLFGPLLGDFGYWDMINFSYGLKISMRTDQPLCLRAEAYSPSNYGAINYHKGVALLMALEWYLTPPVFWKGMHEYFARWHGKHPTVDDFFATMEDISKKDLQGFIKEWYYSTTFNDFALKKHRTVRQDSFYVTKVWVQNKGTMKNFPAPVFLVTQKNDTLENRWKGDPLRPVVFKHHSPLKHLELNLQRNIIESNYLNDSPGLFSKVKFHFFPHIPSFEEYSVSVFPFYWYESFVDRHRIGLSLQTGNPLINYYFSTAQVYYATRSKQWNFNFKLQNRFHFPFANYTDARLEIMNQDGMARQSIGFLNYFQNPADDFTHYTVDVSFSHMDLYNVNYYEKRYFERARYFTRSLKATMSKKRMLYEWQAAVYGTSGQDDLDSKRYFTRVELSTNYKRYFGLNDYFALRGYMGGVNGKGIPLQEHIFAFGNIDPRHQVFMPYRRGKWGAGRGFSALGGMNMVGYNNLYQPFFKGKYGASISAEIKYGFLPGLYYSAALLSNSVTNWTPRHIFSEAGVKSHFSFGAGELQMILPLYVEYPAPGEKKWQWRFVIGLKITSFANMF